MPLAEPERWPAAQLPPICNIVANAFMIIHLPPHATELPLVHDRLLTQHMPVRQVQSAVPDVM